MVSLYVSRKYINNFFSILVLIEKMYETLKTVFDYIFKYLQVPKKYSAARQMSNSLRGIWKCGQTRTFVFDISLKRQKRRRMEDARFSLQLLTNSTYGNILGSGK